jgi:hypothetical protein
MSAPAHDVLKDTYHGRWICRGGPSAWPPCLPDLNPLEFYLWGHLKFLCTAPVDKEDALHHHIVDASQTIRNYSGTFECLQRSMMKHVETYTESHGGHFENLLQIYSFSHNSQIKCF